MKRFIALLLVIVLMLVCAACDGQTKNETENGTNGSSHSDNNLKDDNSTNAEGGNDSTFSGEVTEAVVRSYKVASEGEFNYSETSDGVTINSYLGTDTIVVIPEQIAGKTVVAIDPLIFANDSKVRGVYIPTTVTEIVSTFANNEAIEVVVCEGVEVIGDNTFNGCSSLHTVVLGDNLQHLGNSAFFSCGAIKELYIAPALQEVDSNYAPTVFFWCENLTIQGQAGSYIESFCAEQGIPFEAV